jgi:general secretion pathway protein E
MECYRLIGRRLKLAIRANSTVCHFINAHELSLFNREREIFVRPLNLKLSTILEPDPPRTAIAVGQSLDFMAYLVRRHSITGDLIARFASEERPGTEKKLRDLWELTELSANDFADEVAEFYKLPRLELPQLLAASPQIALFSPRFLRDMALFPCRIGDGSDSVLVVADPSDAVAVRAAELALGGPNALAVASFEDIETVLSERLGGTDLVAPEINESTLIKRDDDIDSLRDLASGAPVVRAVNDLLEKAVELRATDIHIEPFRAGLSLRMRVDGLLQAIPTPSGVAPQALISRIKILAGLNIAERRLPQDGAANMRVARSDIDIRVATMPTRHGESAVIRLLPKDRGVLEIAKLGLSNPDQDRLHRLLELPHGIIVITGPTGSGKTTTLATMLTALNDTSRKILTIEDPIEYEIRGVNQSQVKPEIGLTFAAALRAFVRQDPDVIMVGEVRDPETAQIAIHAALTGHFVLTTLHTETAAMAVPRLLDLGVENFLLQSTLRAVIAQRLVRVLCERCKTERRLSVTAIAEDPRYPMLGLKAGDSLHEPNGCERCSGTGYRGRTGVFEMLDVNDEIRSLMQSRSDSTTIRNAAVRAGMMTMFEHGATKCRMGVTSAAEVFRVTTMR